MFWKRLAISVLSALAVVAIASRINRPVGRLTPVRGPLLEQVIPEVVMDVTTPRAAVRSISNAAKMPISIDIPGVDPYGCEPAPSTDPPIVLRDIRVADALSVMLGHFNYAHQAAVEQHENAIQIQRRQDLPPVRLVGRFYDLGDLDPVLVAEIVGPLSDEAAQVDDPQVSGHYLWIRRTPQGHRRIEDLLDLLHQAFPAETRN